MALKYQSVFKSKDGNTYAINIYDPTYSGSVEQLVPAGEPFVTREDDDDNVFAPMRAQTGYIRVIDTDNDLFNRILPPNNTHLFVRLYQGNWTNNQFYPDPYTPLWQGFVQSQVYTQPWTEHKTVLELPVISTLGALQYITFPANASNAAYNIFQVLQLASDILFAPQGFSGSLWEGRVITCNDLINTAQLYIRRQVLLKSVEVKRVTEGEKTIIEGMTFYDILEQFALLLGFTWREEGYKLILAQMSRYSSTLRIKTINLSDASVASETAINVVDYNGQTSLPVFHSTDNKTSIMQGRRSVQLSFAIKNEGQSVFSFPEAPENTPHLTGMRTWVFSEFVNENGVYVYGTDYDKQLDIEAYAHGSQSGVTYKYLLRQHSSEAEDPEYGQNIMPWSYINTPNKNIWGDSDYILLCGAMPCRFDYHNFNTARTELRHGHILNMWAAQSLNDIEWGGFHGWLMDFTNPFIVLRNSDWINIQLHVIPFYNEHYPTTENPPYPIQTGIKSKTKRIIVKACLKCGDLFFDNRGENYGWSTDQQPLLLRFDPESGNLVGNYNESMGIKDIGGYYVPAPAGTFEFTFQIVNEIYVGAELYAVRSPNGIIRYGQGEAAVDAHTVVMDSLKVQVISRTNYGTRNGDNVYYKDVVTSGFQDKEEVSLDLGTNNNNGAAINTICTSDAAADITEAVYNQGILRPEAFTLDQMANYFTTIRRAYTGRILAGIDWMRSVWKYANRYFYTIIQERDWKQNEETVKFIETNFSN